ncbi:MULTISPECIES: hypothetical protein [Rhodococcus]|uniref:hypothetical protein n=1 Tax=Rhodococcus TaxID=1827 RepID=UPI001358572C|nr:MULTISPECIES: hypothetical protein [Rhodococcus]UOT08117.1 hypothetical protein MPY17_37775 [Rhodococcus opacus]
MFDLGQVDVLGGGGGVLGGVRADSVVDPGGRGGTFGAPLAQPRFRVVDAFPLENPEGE